jgi:long-chain acyl-CoA synthetase
MTRNFFYFKYKTKCSYLRLVFKKTKAALGGRVRIIVTGSKKKIFKILIIKIIKGAPISSNVLDFLKIALACPIVEGYG